MPDDHASAAPSPDPSFVLRGHNVVVHCVAFLCPSSGILVASDERGLVRGWDLESRRPRFEFFAGRAPVLAVRAIADGVLFTQSKAGVLQLWDLERTGGETGTEASPCSSVEHQADIHSFCKSVLLRSRDSYGEVSPIAFPHGSDAVGIWDSRLNVVQSLISPQTGPTDTRKTGACTSLAALDSTTLCGAYEDGAIRVWDVRKQWPLCIQPLHQEPVFGLDIVATSKPGSAACASGGADGCFVLSRLSPQQEGTRACAVTEAGRMPLQSGGNKGINGISIRLDGKVAAAGCWDGRVRLYGVQKPRQLASLQCHTGGVQAVEFSRDGRWLASASEDTRIALWSVFQG